MHVALTKMDAKEREMHKLIENPTTREELRNWAKKAMVDENVEFLVAVKQFKENSLAASKSIYNTYLDENSQLPINHNALVQ